MVHLSPFKSTEKYPAVTIRTFEYTRTKSTLTNKENEAGHKAPLGLHHVRVSELPKVGGPFGLAVAAFTKEEAITKLVELATREHQKAAERADIFAKGIQDLLDIQAALK